MNKVFIGDNEKFFKNLKYFEDKKFQIVYMDPPYNTGNTFKYKDKMEIKEWIEERNSKISNIKKIMKKDSVFIASISEENLFELHQILKNNFKYVFEPLIWLTKSPLNQNKITNISSVCHEYILIASDSEIKSKMEILNIDENINDEVVKSKLENYNLSIYLNKDIEEFETIKIDNKEIIRISKNDYEIKKDFKPSFKGHRFQKRTAQEGHGAKRYIELVQKDLNWNNDNLYFIKNVKDKYNLNGKFILNNSYFQSINNEIKLKLPSFLGYYNCGMNHPTINGEVSLKP